MGAKVERSTGELAVLEVTGQAPIARKQGFAMLGIVCPELRRPRSKACRCVVCQPGDMLVADEPRQRGCVCLRVGEMPRALEGVHLVLSKWGGYAWQAQELPSAE